MYHFIVYGSIFLVCLFFALFFFFVGGEKQESFQNSLPSDSPSFHQEETYQESIPQENVSELPLSSEKDSLEKENSPEVLNDTQKEKILPKQEKPISKEKKETSLEIKETLLSFGYHTPEQLRNIDTIVIHSSYNASGGDVYDREKIIQQYKDYGVGAHYLIDRRGGVYRLIEEKNIAYHAGVSKLPDGRKNVNDFSIGIELMGTKESGFDAQQYSALNALISDIKSRYKIKNIVGHADIAPERKTDPWKFNWDSVKR
ncbi:MAG: N-acetylmuramoyl-L-alanine amidase [Candidatus Moraniibacteriota bacterium]|nr:MAG: N-acetylmuramoyl-L-alanine amidase [Candidatus Moranbacteria bacterium]